MKLTFDPNLSYQLDAIKAVTDIFEGQPSDESLTATYEQDGMLNMIFSIGNKLILSEEEILKNLQEVQKRNEIAESEQLESLDFSVEMETGTGKTYVYLRTIYELNKKYGFKKFVIVVPSVAIREGVLKNLEITYEHFQNLYDHVPVNYYVYDSSKVSALRSFAMNNNIEILVINIDSFAKDENIINRPNDKLNGRNPIEFIQATNPVVILDEPQNMETEKRRKAIANLNPVFKLRYSATHRNMYHMVYSLNPVKAYDLGLVKQIEVDSVVEENNVNNAFIRLEDIKVNKSGISAKLAIYFNDRNGVKKKKVTVRPGDDLYKLSNEREMYAAGFILEEIDADNEYIVFSNGIKLYKGEAQGTLSDEIMKMQMRNTIKEHLEKERRLLPKGIKVLSLFFIDRVANYRQYDADGNPKPGKFAIWFEEIYKELVENEYKDLNKFSIEEIHNGYFSKDKKGKLKDTKGNTKADDDTYRLIMKDKERLLDINTPLRFIFSHSALREGWDNPNVFQICTLNETQSEMKKRQEIGRGLRLAVNSEGKRIYDRNINRLTVVANEAYEDFAKTLQKEIQEDCGVSFEGRVKNKRKRVKIKYRKGFEIDPEFLALWERLKHKTTYRVHYDTAKLIEESAKEINHLPEIKPPVIRSTKVRLEMHEDGVDTLTRSIKTKEFSEHKWKIPDVLAYIQSKTELTRYTIYDILRRSDRLGDLLKNPQLFMDLSVQAIQRVLHDFMIEGIKYQKINGQEYEMKLFESEELQAYLDDKLFEVSDPSKTIYENFIPLDSQVESQFAKDCETSEQVKFYFKLPHWFKIPTPIGTYNPDWALVFEDDRKVYFVAETKDTGTDKVDLNKLKPTERMKIKCGVAHFKEFDDIEYKVVKRLNDLI